MLYIHHHTCLSPQLTHPGIDLETLQSPIDNKLKAIEPAYEGIPPGMLRRMGTAIRLGVGAALNLLKTSNPTNGIIIGTAKGGMEDCIRFLNQIVQYEEGVLAPGSFVQSTTNAIAGTLGLMSGNKGYNITHTHRGLAFENAVIDAILQLHDHPDHTYLLGGVDEISSFNYNLERLSGAYKTETVDSDNFYALQSKGSIAGEAAAMFLVNGKEEGSGYRIEGISTLHSDDDEAVKEWTEDFLSEYNATPSLLLSGENGDQRHLHFYENAENLLPPGISIARFKHMCGEFPTTTAFAVWFAGTILQSKHIPAHAIKKQGENAVYKSILIYNNFKGIQHSLMLVSE